jgi:hypothetical protein
MRANAKPNDVIRAFAKAIEATFASGDWLDLALLTDTEHVVQGHRRLLRSLEWNDRDYSGNVLEVLPAILGDRGLGSRPGVSAAERFPNVRVVENRVGLQQWLSANEPVLHEALYGGDDKVVLDDLQETSERLGLPDVAMHAARIRRSIHEDPAQAIGSAKELLETTLKAVLGLHGTGPETKVDVPQLVKRANIKLGLDAATVDADEPGAQHQRRVLGSLAQVVNSTAELRNAGFGTGHGVSRGPELDVATARMVVSAAVTVATFYVEAHAAHERRDSGPTFPI